MTTSDIADAKWLMPNDFVAAVGHRFNFRTRPIGDWDGVVHCEVLDCDPPRLLRYSWKGGADTNPEYGSKLDSVVTWTLTPVEGGTMSAWCMTASCCPGNRLRVRHDEPGLGQDARWRSPASPPKPDGSLVVAAANRDRGVGSCCGCIRG